MQYDSPSSGDLLFQAILQHAQIILPDHAIRKIPGKSLQIQHNLADASSGKSPSRMSIREARPICCREGAPEILPDNPVDYSRVSCYNEITSRDDHREKEADNMAYTITDACISCGACAEGCPVEAISQGETQYQINPDLCTDCGSCADTCPVGAPTQA